MSEFTDTFGPWTPPGTGGTQPTNGDTPSPTTPATELYDQFWDARTEGYCQVREVPPWQRCKLGPYDLPGIVEVDAPGASQTIDAKAAQAKGGETLTVKGWTGSDVTITCLLWTPPHLTAWREISKEIDPVQQDTHEALDISAECLVGTSIKSVLVKRVQPLKRGGVPGTRIGVIEAKQFVPKPKSTSTGTPKGSKSNNSAPDDTVYWNLVSEYETLRYEENAPTWDEFKKSKGYTGPEPPCGPPAP